LDDQPNHHGEAAPEDVRDDARGTSKRKIAPSMTVPTSTSWRGVIPRVRTK
jgi:hypothetical protein